MLVKIKLTGIFEIMSVNQHLICCVCILFFCSYPMAIPITVSGSTDFVRDNDLPKDKDLL